LISIFPSTLWGQIHSFLPHWDDAFSSTALPLLPENLDLLLPIPLPPFGKDLPHLTLRDRCIHLLPLGLNNPPTSSRSKRI
jgi:hypothetical protein